VRRHWPAALDLEGATRIASSSTSTGRASSTISSSTNWARSRGLGSPPCSSATRPSARRQVAKITLSPASRSLNAKQNRRGRRKSRVTSTRCPLCAYPIRDHDVDVVECARCRALAHEPCFWRALPIDAWRRYLRWREEAGPASTFERRWICATCRRSRGAVARPRKALARMSRKSVARARAAACVCSHLYAHHRHERSRIATVCERCSCVGFTPRDQHAWNRLLAGRH
jgi:hypothetical protein